MFHRKKCVRIEPTLHAEAAKLACQRGYDSVDAMVDHLLTMELRASGKDADKNEHKTVDRLKGLGYL